MNTPVKSVKNSLKILKAHSINCPKQLKIWPEACRASPNVIFRSCLFSPRRDAKRKDFHNEPIVVIGTSKITYRGQELRTHDEDVWLEIMHLARVHNLGKWIEFNAYDLIRSIGWVKPNRKTGKMNNPSVTHKLRLKECISRMQATTITVESVHIDSGCSVSLIQEFEWEGLKKWRVWISPKMKLLFGDKYFTHIEWEQRIQLSPTAKRLHGYYASHSKPYEILVEKLYKFCQAKSKIPQFKQKLYDYLNELVRVGFLETYKITKNKVYVKRIKTKGRNK